MNLLSEIKALIGHFIIHYPDTPLGWKLRYKYWKRVHQNNLGNNIQIYRGTKIGLKDKVFIGDNFTMGEYSTLAAGDSEPLFVGNFVTLAKNVYVRTANHEFSNRNIPIMQQGHNSKVIEYNNNKYSIVIEDDVWIAVNAIILSGSHIGKGSIIGAGAVVNSKIPEYSIAAGVPARVIGKR